MAEPDKKASIGFFGKLLIIAIAMGVVVVGGASLFLAFQDNTTEDFIIIKADVTPIREKPIEAGGADIDHQDSAVLQMLDDIKAPNGDVDRLVLPDASPELPPVPLPEDEIQLSEDNNPIIAIAPVNTAEIEGGNQAANSGEGEDTPLLTNESISNIIAKNLGTDSGENGLEDSPGQIDTELAVPTPRPVSDEEANDTDASANGPKIITEPETYNEQNPPFMVQLAAFRDQLKAEQAAAVLTEKHSDRLLSLQLGIMSIDTGSSGIFWRVITEPLPAPDARMICDALKLAGQDCILRPVSTSGL